MVLIPPATAVAARWPVAYHSRRALWAGVAWLLLATCLATAVRGVETHSPLAPGRAPEPGEVTLPLAEYLALVDQADAATRAKALRAAREPAAAATLAAQRTHLRVDGGEAVVTAELEVLVDGPARAPVALPFPGYPATVEVLAGGVPTSTAAVAALAGGGAVLVPTAPGRYTVRMRGRAPLLSDGGVGRLALPAIEAPVAIDEVDLAADVAWEAPASVVVDERVEGGRRLLRLAGRRGQKRTLELRRHFDGAEAEKLLARSVVLTLFELRPEGVRRHDVVLYEVDRGSLASLTVELPAGLELVEVATDEGVAVPALDGNRLTVHRQRQLQSVGYLVLTSAPASVTELSLAPPRPSLEVRARYLAIATAVAAEAHPLPAAAWSQVDLDDLPPLLREALQVVDLAAAWRQVDLGGESRLAVAELPPAERTATVRRRDTTTLLTVDGTAVHRDRFVLADLAAGGAAATSVLELTLPAGATLWSARVGEQPVRPLQRGAGIVVPLGFGGGATTVVEVVSVVERAIPPGRSRLGLELPAVAVPVLDHRWRLLLPENARYRYRTGDLRPAFSPAPAGRWRGSAWVSTTELEKIPTAREPWAILQAAPGVLTDRTNVGGNESGQESTYAPGAGATGPTASYGPGGTAGLDGVIVDAQGAPLPGVTLTLTSAAVPRPIVQVTNAQGQFRFLALPSGSYAARAALEGFSTIDYPDLRVTAGRRTQVEVTMSAAVEDVITVTGESPLLDERRLSTGTTVTLDESARSFDFDSFGETRKGQQRAAGARAAALYAAEAHDLEQGLVGGVKPLPVAIPEAGKALLLTGVLPPSRVAVELEVKAVKR